MKKSVKFSPEVRERAVRFGDGAPGRVRITVGSDPLDCCEGGLRDLGSVAVGDRHASRLALRGQLVHHGYNPQLSRARERALPARRMVTSQVRAQ
jgi:hypothetical protein